MSTLLLGILLRILITYGSHASQHILGSKKLNLYSDGTLQYFAEIPAQQDFLCSVLGGFGPCTGKREKKVVKKDINLSHNLQIKKTTDTALQIIDITTDKPLPNFPGTFDSKKQLNEWVGQLKEIVKYAESHTQYIGISLKQKIYLSLSGSPIFFGFVVFIGNIKGHDITVHHSEQPCFAIQISQKEMKARQLRNYIDTSLISDGYFDNIQYFNFMNNMHDTFIVLDASQMFFHHKPVGVNHSTKKAAILPETKDFFTLTMPQIWQQIESELEGKDVSVSGFDYKIHIDTIDLTGLNVRLFNHEIERSLDNASFFAKVKLFGNVTITLHLTTIEGRKYSHSELRINKLYIEGDTDIDYRFSVSDANKQILKVGFLRAPMVEILQSSNVANFPMRVTDEPHSHPIDWLEWIIETHLEMRDLENMISWDISSPYDD